MLQQVNYILQPLALISSGNSEIDIHLATWDCTRMCINNINIYEVGILYVIFQFTSWNLGLDSCNNA